MSPSKEIPMDVDEFFATEWGSMSRRISAMLARSGARPHDRDDVVQETALRLYRGWGMVDVERGVEPYAKVIAMNVWRDVCRRASTVREVPGDVPEVAVGNEVERIGMARDELRRVTAAFVRLRPSERVALRDAACAELRSEAAGVTPAAARMARMRARRSLALMLRTASVVAGVLGALRGRSSVLRPATTAAACTSVVMLMLALAPPGRGSQPETPVVLTPQTSVVATTTSSVAWLHSATSTGAARAAAGSSSSLARRAPARAAKPKPARVNVADVVEATIHADVDVFGYRVQVKDRGEGQVPVCVTGAGVLVVIGDEC
jgi:DNA-directed RNA polymerase specialized sigma24 family protein